MFIQRMQQSGIFSVLQMGFRSMELVFDRLQIYWEGRILMSFTSLKVFSVPIS